MKRLSAILTIAALVLLFHVAHISVCYSADNAADPNIEAMAESGSDMIVPAVASQAVTPVADSSKALIIRIPLPEGKVIITGIIILICLVLAVIYIRSYISGAITRPEILPPARANKHMFSWHRMTQRLMSAKT